MSLPPGCYGRIAPRSGLAIKKFIDAGAGVIDSDYRGELGVILFNFGEEDFTVNMGDRIAQLIFEKIKTPTIKETNDLEGTGRGEGSYGSIGVNAVQTGSRSDFKQSSPSTVSVSVQEINQTSSDENTESIQRMMRERRNDVSSKQTPLSQS